MDNFNFARSIGVNHALRAVKSRLTAFSKVNKSVVTRSTNQHNRQKNTSAIQQDWQRIGKDMRIGILEYDRKKANQE